MLHVETEEEDLSSLPRDSEEDPWMPPYLCNLLGEAVHRTLQNFDDLLMVGRIFSKADLQLPEELPALLKCLLLLKLSQRKKIQPSRKKKTQKEFNG